MSAEAAETVNEALIALTKETATEYDFILGIDASGSMNADSTRYAGKSRWEEVQEIAFGIAAGLARIDADGLDIVVFGGDVQLHEGVTANKVADIFASRVPNGGTPLTGALEIIVAKQKASQKNTVAIIFTDGEPGDRASVKSTIVNAANGLEKDENLTFLFVQIGTDPSATKFLEQLDDDLTEAKFDIVDSVQAHVAETLSPIDLINKAIND